ncbi:MAG: transposase [Nitrospinae bacterium]|nr:transposase [Nitrospinota bacterium]
MPICIARKMEDIHRFPDSPKFASYCGTVPKVHASGGETGYGHLRPHVTRPAGGLQRSCQRPRAQPDAGPGGSLACEPPVSTIPPSA